MILNCFKLRIYTGLGVLVYSKNLSGEHSGSSRKYFGQTNHSKMMFCVSL